MEQVTRVLATTHEVSLKSGNRRWFERKLGRNVRRALDGLPVANVSRPQWRVLVRFSEPVEFSEVARRLRTVFGLHAILPVEHAGMSIEDVAAKLAPRLEGLSPSSFAVRCNRSDKTFPMTSVEIERSVGGAVQEATGWPVNLGAPDLMIRLLLDGNGFWMWMGKVAGPGGLPGGTGGRAACLLSGGIDSPVAAYLMMKRGMQLDFVHFHSLPRTGPQSVEKVEEIVRVFNRYQGPARLALVPLLPIQEEIVDCCPERFRVVLYRRFMLRLAERLASRLHARALVTGESLGQVASQTIENIAAVANVTRLPILRPLIGLDKQEIIRVARETGTYEISIEPFVDCCSLLVPDRPATRSEAQQLEEAEATLDVDRLVESALDATEIRRIDDPAPWEDIPVPPEIGA